jgi:predicted nucleotide-binding protein
VASLRVSRDEAASVIDEQIAAGEGLIQELESSVRDELAYDAWKLRRSRWESFTCEALNHVYNDDEVAANEFTTVMSHMVYVGHHDWTGYARGRLQDTKNGVNTLLSIKERLRFTEAPPAAGAATLDRVPEELGPAVIFLVHGRNKSVREEVARFLEKAGEHEVVILDEQASRGRTLIEKFEKHAGEAKYAVVLLTGDDEGGAKGEAQRSRARQNVVFELGFFFGRLGREHVTVLYEADVEKPSDVDGLVYVSLSDDWRRLLARELRDAGLAFDLNRA